MGVSGVCVEICGTQEFQASMSSRVFVHGELRGPVFGGLGGVGYLGCYNISRPPPCLQRSQQTPQTPKANHMTRLPKPKLLGLRAMGARGPAFLGLGGVGDLTTLLWKSVGSLGIFGDACASS